MSTQGLKQQALEKLKKLDDDLILKEIYRLLQLPDADIDVHKFTDSQLTLLKERERAIDAGEIFNGRRSRQRSGGMVKEVIWSREASQDRNRIFTYWNKRNKSNAFSRKLFFLFNEAIATIKSFPAIGKPTNNPNTRIIIARDYFIIYSIHEEFIRILAVWDSRQDPSILESLLER